MSTSANKKQKYTYIWVSSVILIFGIIFVPRIVNRLRNGEVVEKDRLTSTQGNSAKPLGYVPQNGENRRIPFFELLSQDSTLFNSSELDGKVVVLDFFFTTCPTICPIMSRNMARLQKEFKGEDLAFVSISINPRYDLPSRLRSYAAQYGAEEGWFFLTGDQEEIYRLSREGFYMYAQEDTDAEGGFEHSGLFALADAEGFIRSREDENGNPLIYYRGAILEEQGVNSQGEKEQISLLREDIKRLLEENK